ncbi:hypothetical protein WR25_01197 [Diploscapter pachys]|uniref:Phosphorylase b kinase regulatory subunit n=1 Tax=Diploscapter pachys TaxID=2018661 RepID=A0A2A2KRI3_9BILA|nr:hypothetical protein WR25_01197 [Diploscapter pachys]
MRSRSGSGVRLDRILFLVEQTICKQQDAITALFANQKEFPGHAWVRDNVYIAQALWALYRAYMKYADFDEDLTKANELAMTCVKMMQSLLECMMLQADKVELFKKYQRPLDSLHAKYSVRTKQTVVSDTEWGHLQVDAVSLYLLTLAQITASGLQIVRNSDEVAFVQNLVYYIETGYRTPDYGIWERGDKTNQGIRELNASSIGLVKAALQSLNDVGDLFVDGSKGSVVTILPDEIEQCSAVLLSMLPRESFSKETDAALLCIISYPAFSVEDPEIVNETRETIKKCLFGNYGCRRFLRDGYKTALEDRSRLYYNKSELQQFEDIECEWPLFLCMFLLDAMYNKRADDVEFYWQQLEKVVIRNDKGLRMVPELYLVERQNVAGEKASRGSQPRTPSGAIPYLWAQSLYVICSLLFEGFLTPAELDPLSRRLAAYEKRPPCEVQVTILAEDASVQEELAKQKIFVQRVDQIDDEIFTILPASSLAHLLTRRFMDSRRSHLMYDIRIMMDEWSSELQYIYASWNSVSISGRPLVVLIINNGMLSTEGLSQLNISLNRHMMSTVVGTIKKISTGYLYGARVVMKNLSDFFRTTAVSKLEISEADQEELLCVNECKVQFALPNEENKDKIMSPASSLKKGDSLKLRNNYDLVRKMSMRHRSIALDGNDSDLAKLRLEFKSHRTLDTVMGGDSSRESSPAGSPSREKVRNLGTPSKRMREKRESTSSKFLHTTSAGSDSDISLKRDLSQSQLGDMDSADLIDMLLETTNLDEQTTIIHFLWMKFGPDYKMFLGDQEVTVRILMEEVYTKSCEARQWALVRLTAGLLGKRFEELGKAVTHLLVRQKQITLGLPSKREEVITCPKTNEELKDIMQRAYGDDPNSFTLSQEILISLGFLVRTDPKLFVEMFRLRIGLIIQSLRKSTRSVQADVAAQVQQQQQKEEESGSDVDEMEDFQFGIWLRHRRIDGALNRVPNNFYASLWDTVHRMPHGLRINDTVLHWGLTQEMTRKEIKFALEVEEALNRIAEPEYRELVVEVLWLLGRLDKVVCSNEPKICKDRPLNVDEILHKANDIFVEHNRQMDTMVMECCGSGKRCEGAKGICLHFYDSAPAGEYGSSHYIIRAMMQMFT